MSESTSEFSYAYDGTKRDIVLESARLFYKKGYDGVSMREIAQAVDVKASSIYNHFSSKEDILHELFDLYEFHLNDVLPDMDTLLKEIGKEDPCALVLKCLYSFPAEIQEFMDQVVVIGIQESKMNKRSSEFVHKVLIETPDRIMRTLLEHLIETKRIKPLDISAFIVLLTNFCFSAALRNSGDDPVLPEDWMAGYRLLTSLIQPTGYTFKRDENLTENIGLGLGSIDEDSADEPADANLIS